MNSENNKIIDIFMKSKGEYISHKDFWGGEVWGDYKPNNYHSNWNLLIEAIGKLNENMKSSIFKTHTFSSISSMILINDINQTYQYFIKALNHYNKNK